MWPLSTNCTPRPKHCFTAVRASDSTNEPAIVVSPLRNAAGELAGAVYGYRSVREGNARRTIRYLEAHMIELLAGAVSEGIARIEREAETDRRRVLLEQAAAISQNQSSREIVTDEREVTLLFADLRNSTALAAALEPNETYELLSQVMECLTAAVIDHDGLIIDYYGDGLAAMWNAPADQSDHPELACRAALRMLQALPASRAIGPTCSTASCNSASASTPAPPTSATRAPAGDRSTARAARTSISQAASKPPPSNSICRCW